VLSLQWRGILGTCYLLPRSGGPLQAMLADEATTSSLPHGSAPTEPTAQAPVQPGSSKSEVRHKDRWETPVARSSDLGIQGEPRPGETPIGGSYSGEERTDGKSLHESPPAWPGLEREPPRIALYEDSHHPPLVVSIAETRLPQLLDAITTRVYELAKEQGGRLPYPVLRELVDNLVHASFEGVVVTILDRGNTVRVSDRGPGIRDKEAVLQPGFTSADAAAKQYIRGVGSGFSVIRETLGSLDGALEIEDNLGRGTVVTVRVALPPEKTLASRAVPTYNLPERQLKTLLLTVELAPVGPTRIAEELGVATSTAYRDLVALEHEGFVSSRASGHRVVTDAGLAYLDEVL